jgi:hypothetical protein
MADELKSRRVGSVRPSQLMYTYGVGSAIDLPSMSVIVGGLDEWDTAYCHEIAEQRLLEAVRAALGPQVERLLSPPWMDETRNVNDDWARVGIPVMPFPRWMRCPRCDLLSASVGAGSSDLFRLEVPVGKPDRARFVHTNCTRASGKPPSVIPARFVVACTDGHIDEFPWIEFCHARTGGACTAGAPSLRIRDLGRGTRSTDVLVECRACAQTMHLANAFNDSREATMPRCRGREAHLRRFKPGGCSLQVRPLLLGASNAWFPLTMSALSIPSAPDQLGNLLLSLAGQLAAVTDRSHLEPALQFNPSLAPLQVYDLDAVWARLCEIRGTAMANESTNLLRPEWDVLTDPVNAPATDDFRLVAETVPTRFAADIQQIVRAERLREVVALTGFTRIDSPDSGVGEDVDMPNRAPLARQDPTWVPAAEVRGEGIFLVLPEKRLRPWEDAAGASGHGIAMHAAHARWRARRGLSTSEGWRGHRYTLLHSLSHLLINELAMECGYSAASIRERIYWSEGESEAMAGILLYTAAPDSEGTLGGLVSLARPATFERLVLQALQRAQLCAADPMCAEHIPHETEDSLHGAACHACLFIPETSCERGNRYLDRAMVVPTLSHRDLAFFQIS